MIVIKNVLVATDFSEPATAALDYGRELARSYGATLHVLHAVDDIRWRYSLDMSAALLTGVQEDLTEHSRVAMDRLLTEEDHSQLHAKPVTLISASAADSITEYAKSANIDLIVIGTHGRRGVSHLLMGSVAERVVRLAPCPVLTVRAHEREFLAPDALAVTQAKP